MIKILFFGRLSDAAQPMSCDLPNEVSTIGDLSLWLGQGDAALNEALQAKGNRIALNQIICDENAVIKDGDEIAFMSPLSGG